MSAPLWMVELRPDWLRWLAWGREEGILPARDPRTDLGYLAHAWMQALFGPALAPRPFRLWTRGQAEARILGYARATRAQLLEQAQSCAAPAAWEALGGERGLRAKPMPDAWRRGAVFGFECLVAPTRRSKKGGDEKDALLVMAERTGQKAGLARAEVYRAWFAERVPEGVVLLDWQLAGFRLVDRLRRTQGAPRRGRWVRLPEALVRGRLRVEDPAAFADWLARGVGRHRAFGYGMVLLHPA